jgi:hypothetical protein
MVRVPLSAGARDSTRVMEASVFRKRCGVAFAVAAPRAGMTGGDTLEGTERVDVTVYDDELWRRMGRPVGETGALAALATLVWPVADDRAVLPPFVGADASRTTTVCMSWTAAWRLSMPLTS